VTILDDDDDSDRDGLTAIIVDDCDCVEGLGFWKKEFKGRSEKDAKKVEKGQLIDEPTLAAYLDIIRFASSHFDENVPLTTFVDASRVLNPEKHRDTGPGSNNKGGSKEGTNPSATGSRKKKSGDTNHDESDSNTGTGKNIAKKREDALKHTLSAWLNFAKGAVDWDEDIVVEGGTGTGTRAKPVVAMPFNEVIAEVEAILNNPDAAHDDLVHAKNLAESINKHDDGNKDCGTDSGSGSGTASRESKSEDDIKGSDSGSQKRGKKKDK
ncbi:MAG: hypothetical protein QF898_15570, partial [SAR202 cluster bacterium]|jgi:hypothetical protein|nr:hypothetical protein [SAR202 cluster bacterium]